MHHFPILSFFLFLLLLFLLLLFIIVIIFFVGGGGGKSKLSIMIATLKKNRMEQPFPPPIPLRTRMIYVKAITCHLFGGDGGSYGELRGRYSGVPLLDFHGIRLLLSGQTM